MEKVLISGGAGFIGYHLTARLLSKGYKIHLLDNYFRGVNDRLLQELLNDKHVQLINADLLHGDIFDQLENNYTYIYHLAAVVGVQHVQKAPYSVLVKNVELSKNALAIAAIQNNLKRFIFTSTSEVYAGTLKNFGLDFPTPETTPLSVTGLQDNRTSYMLSKIYGEAMCLHSGVPVTIVRPHNFYGPRMGMSHVIPELLKNVYESEDGSLDVYSVDHKRTFCFINDAVEIMIMLAENSEAVGQSFNVGNQNDEITMVDLAKMIFEVVGKNIRINPLSATAGSVERRCPDMTKTQNLIGYQPKYTLREGLNRTFDWYRNNIFNREEICAI